MTTGERVQSEVLIVDDLQGTREILREMLQEIGFINIEEASDGIEAMDKLKTHRFGLIISDFDMKRMSGLEFLFEVRKNSATKELPFIMLSAKTDPTTIDQAQREGKAHFLFKPLDYNQLEAKIMQLIRRRFTE